VLVLVAPPEEPDAVELGVLPPPWMAEAPAPTALAFLEPQAKLRQKVWPARLLAELLTHWPFQLSHSRDGRVWLKSEMLGVVPVRHWQLYVREVWG
jgi:hypothetical protein